MALLGRRRFYEQADHIFQQLWQLNVAFLDCFGATCVAADTALHAAIFLHEALEEHVHLMANTLAIEAFQWIDVTLGVDTLA